MSPSKYEQQLEQASDLAEEITEYIVNSFTNMVIWQTEENGDIRYTEDVQDIYNNVYDMTAASIIVEATA